MVNEAKIAADIVNKVIRAILMVHTLKENSSINKNPSNEIPVDVKPVSPTEWSANQQPS